MVFDWNKDPFHLDLYKNPTVLFFDIILLPISCTFLTIIFIIWNYQLFFAKPKTVKRLNRDRAMSAETMGSMSSSGGGNSKHKPKIDLSLPTLTAPVELKSSKSDESNEMSPEPPEQSKTHSKEQSPQPSTPDTETKNKVHKRRTRKQKDMTKEHQSIHWISKLLTTTSVTLAMLFMYFLTLIVILSIQNDHPKCIYIALCFLLIYIQRLCLYLYYIFRAYITFANTVYKLSKKYITFVTITITCIWIISLLFFLIWDAIINPFGHYCTEIVILISIIPLGISEFCIATFCVFLFVCNLKKVYNRKLDGHSEANYRLEYLLTKLTILSAVTIISTFSILSIFPFTFALGLMAIDTPINVICLMLSFGIYDKYYQKLCIPCRNCCEKQPPLKRNSQTSSNITKI